MTKFAKEYIDDETSSKILIIKKEFQGKKAWVAELVDARDLKSLGG